MESTGRPGAGYRELPINSTADSHFLLALHLWIGSYALSMEAAIYTISQTVDFPTSPCQKGGILLDCLAFVSIDIQIIS